MLDIKYIRHQPEAVKKAIKVKNIVLDLDELLLLDKELTAAHQALQELQRQKNKNAQKFKAAVSNEEKETIAQTGKNMSLQISELQSSIKGKQSRFQELMLQVPNIPSEDSPIGKDDSANEVIKTVGEKPKSRSVKNHLDLLLQNNWADFQRIAQVSGSRSYCLKNEAVLLEQALIQWSTQHLIKAGFEIFSLPNFGDRSSFIGSGHFPEGEDQVYYIEKDNIYLTGTAEVVLNSLHRGEVLSEEKLPLLMGGLSPCFRREAGSAGKEVRGLLRVHQFVKLEQYVICESNKEEAHRWHAFLLNNSEEVLQALELPYRVVKVSTGDMGAGKYKMHDVECWLPSLNKYVETHSCSSLLDWQARRTNLRYRGKDNKVHYCYTLNNTAMASPRLLAVFLENHQREDGAIYIPPALRTYLGTSFLVGSTR
ncbi:MAG: serine--tRNA ligase [Bdellovibrionales bacterium]|nr:serine--tRNA ligase [Bdellovibrionales bacterium]